MKPYAMLCYAMLFKQLHALLGQARARPRQYGIVSSCIVEYGIVIDQLIWYGINAGLTSMSKMFNQLSHFYLF